MVKRQREHSPGNDAMQDSAEVCPPRPLPLFAPRQFVNQRWAAWFKDATEIIRGRHLIDPPRKSIPAWWAGQVISYIGFQEVFYAGMQHEAQHTYRVLCWDGSHEIIPEEFLYPREPHTEHVEGRMVYQAGPQPPYIFGP